MSRSAVVLARLAGPAPAVTPDAQLLRSFVASREGDAFAELVRRHGPMVLATCRRVLSDSHDAEDAFQAVFLVLARKAGTIRGTNLGGWLYGVAVRTARGVRVTRDRRRKHSQQESGNRKQGTEARADRSLSPDSCLLVTEQAAVIDEELAKLPDYYRDAVVLCELRGLSRKQAAAELGVAEGTLSSRLASAKRKLAERLSARGLAGAVALAALAPAVVSAALHESALLAIRGVAGGAASAAASTVLKGMLFDQLRTTVFAAVVLIAGVCGVAMVGSPVTPGKASEPVAPATRSAPDPAAGLVKQLGSEDFAEREAAAQELRKLGPKAEAALKTGLKSDDPEVRARCARLLGEIRKDALDSLVKNFDPTIEAEPDHPIWKRFKALAGDTRGARELFARILKNKDWLRRLDTAESGPEAAARQYREAVAEVGRAVRSNLKVGFMIYVWPCDVADQVAYLLFLGSYAGTEKAKPAGNDPDAEDYRYGEAQIYCARGLRLGLEGKEIAPGPKNHYDATAALPAGSDRAFAKLLAAWVVRHTTHDSLHGSFWLAARFGVPELLPLARKIAADALPLDSETPARVKVAALAAIAALGTPADLKLFTPLFDDKTVVATLIFTAEGPAQWPEAVPPKDRPAAAREVFTAQARDCAYALALLLHGENPAAHGFPRAALRGKPDQPPRVGVFDETSFGFLDGDDKSRTAAHAKAKAFLDKRKDAPKKEEPKPDPVAVKLVRQLASEDFAERESAAAQLRELGAKAESALRAGLTSDDPEVRARCAKILGEIRKDALNDLAKKFDPAQEQQPDHPIWRRFKALAGDTRASRELFAKIIANKKWLQTLDNAEANPSKAGHIYRVGIAEMFRDFHNDPAKSPPWPCDRPEEVAYLLLLGSHADPNPPAKLTGDEVPPAAPRGLAFLGRGIIVGEGQIIHANGLTLGLEGKWLVWQTTPAATGTDRAFAKLFAAWLAQRPPASEVVPRGFQIASDHRIAEFLPLARRYAANDFEPKRDVPPLATIKALELVAQLGTRADLPLFERHFGDSTNVAAVDKPRDDGARDYFRPAPLTDTTQMRDVALGLALLLHGSDPADFGFLVRKDTFKTVDGRYTIPRTTQLHLGFRSDEDRTAAFKKAKVFLDKQKEKAFEEQLKAAEAEVKRLGLVEVKTVTNSVDPDSTPPLQFQGKAGPVRVPIGSAVLVELPPGIRALKWNVAGGKPEEIGEKDGPVLSHVLCKWTAAGTLTFTTYRTPANKDKENEKEKPDPVAAKLVEQLGSADFAEREKAQKELRELGAKAEAALKAGLRSDEPEVRNRCGKLLDALRADRLVPPDSPVWQKFKAVAGDGDEAKKLYLRMASTARRGEMLLAAVADPKAAVASYDRECEEMATAIKYSRIGGQVPPPKPAGLEVREVTTDDLAAVLFLGTLPRGDQKQPDKESTAVHDGALRDALRGETKAAFARLYAAWAEPRPEYYASSLSIGLDERLPVLAGVARRALAVKDRPPWADIKGPALQFLGLHGTAADIPLVLMYAGDKAECGRLAFSKVEGGAIGPWRPAVKNTDVVTQVRDVAAIAALRLSKKHPGEFGFEADIVQDGGPPPAPSWLGHLGFCRDADRDTAHTKARAWLDKQKK